MKIGLDLDGTLYAHPAFFDKMIDGMMMVGCRFYCISSHGRDEWPRDIERLKAKGVTNAEHISPELMHHERHGDLTIKGRAADQCDVVFDDDVRLKDYTQTPVMAPL